MRSCPLDERGTSGNGLQIHQCNLGVANNALEEGAGDPLKKESKDFNNKHDDGENGTSDEGELEKVVLDDISMLLTCN